MFFLMYRFFITYIIYMLFPYRLSKILGVYLFYQKIALSCHILYTTNLISPMYKKMSSENIRTLFRIPPYSEIHMT